MSIPADLRNGDSAEYWRHAAESRLVFQQCRCCRHVQFPPRHQCAQCWETTLDWIESTGRGTVESVTIVRRAPLAEFREDVPYALAAVRVAEGPRMITQLAGDDALTVGIGDTVQVTFSPDRRGRTLPRFQRAAN